jgi:hypothetical protein
MTEKKIPREGGVDILPKVGILPPKLIVYLLMIIVYWYSGMQISERLIFFLTD